MIDIDKVAGFLELKKSDAFQKLIDKDFDINEWIKTYALKFIKDVQKVLGDDVLFTYSIYFLRQAGHLGEYRVDEHVLVHSLTQVEDSTFIDIIDGHRCLGTNKYKLSSKEYAEMMQDIGNDKTRRRPMKDFFLTLRNAILNQWDKSVGERIELAGFDTFSRLALKRKPEDAEKMFSPFSDLAGKLAGLEKSMEESHED